MKQSKLISSFLIVFLSCQITFSQTKVPLSIEKELIAAETRMFDAMLTHDVAYWKNNVTNEYLSINADGVMQTKQEAMEDHARAKMFSGVSYKISDRKIRLYGNAAIINGRSQYLVNDKVVAEVFHTEIWKREKGKWMFNGWQGTLTKEAQANINSQQKQ